MNTVLRKPRTEKNNRLLELSARNPVIHLNADKFNDYVQSTERDYSIIVLFTSSLAEDHSDTRKIYHQYQAVAKSMATSHLKAKLFFGMVDIAKEAMLFNHVKMCYLRDTDTSITKMSPMIMHFPQCKSLTQADYIDLEHVKIEDIGDMILTMIKIRVVAQQNIRDKIIAYLSFMWFLHDRQFWACVFVVYCILNVSGDTWNKLNDAGWFYSADGQTFTVFANENEQTILESYIVMFLIIVYVASMILVIEYLGNKKKYEKNKWKIVKARITTVIGTGLVYGSFFILAILFSVKMNTN